MGFLAVDSLFTAIVAVAIVVLVLLGNELYFRSLRKRNDLSDVRKPRRN
jgi:hypothetical protein